MPLELKKLHIYPDRERAHLAHSYYRYGDEGKDGYNIPYLLAPSRIPEMLQFCRSNNLGFAATDSKDGLLPIWFFKKV